MGRRRQRGGLLPLLMANVIRRKTRESFKRRRAREDKLLQEGAGSGKRRKRKNRKQKGGFVGYLNRALRREVSSNFTRKK